MGDGIGREISARFSLEFVHQQFLRFWLVLLDPLRQFDIRVCDFFYHIVPITQKLHARDKPSRDGIFIFNKNARLRVTFQSRDSWLNGPYRINPAILEQWELIRILRWDHRDIAAGLRDIECM